MTSVLHLDVPTAFFILKTRILSFSLLSTLSFLSVLDLLKKVIVIVAVDKKSKAFTQKFEPQTKDALRLSSVNGINNS